MVNNFRTGNLVVENFKMYLNKEHKSSNTIKTYCRCIEEFINWYHENKNEEAVRLKKDDIKNYENYLRCVKKQKSETINVKLCALAMYESFLTRTSI